MAQVPRHLPAPRAEPSALSGPRAVTTAVRRLRTEQTLIECKEPKSWEVCSRTVTELNDQAERSKGFGLEGQEPVSVETRK